MFNIGNGQRVELLRYIEVLEEKLGRKATLNLMPMQPGDVARTEADVEATRAAEKDGLPDRVEYAVLREGEQWKKRDPIARLLKHLELKNLWDDGKQKALEAHAEFLGGKRRHGLSAASTKRLISFLRSSMAAGSRRSRPTTAETV